MSRDGSRVYFTNSLYGAWDDQFYPEGVGAWMVKLDVDPASPEVVTRKPGSKAMPRRRPHQVRLQGGDASSDSYCYP